MRINIRLGLLLVLVIMVMAILGFAGLTGISGGVIVAILVAGGFLISVIIIKTSYSITQRLARLTEAVNNFNKGNPQTLTQTVSQDEFDLLEASITELFQTSLKWSADITALGKKQAAGDIDALLDERKYQGDYKEAAREINTMVQGNNRDIEEILTCVSSYGQGDFNVKMESFSGKKARYNQTTDVLKNNLKSVINDLQASITAYSEGRLTVAANAAVKNGDWGKLVRDMNGLSDALGRPIKEATEAVNRIAIGNFSQTLTEEFNGDFAMLKQALNKATKNLSDYENDLTTVLKDMTSAHRIHRAFNGPFPAIKEAVAALENRLTHLEKDSTEPKPTRTGFNSQLRSGSPVVRVPSAKPSTPGGFNAALPVIASKTLTAPNASHIYNSRDFGKYK